MKHPQCELLGLMQAFFLSSAEELQKWVATHPEYTVQQVLSLAQGVAHLRGLKKKERAILLAQVPLWLSS